MKVSTTGKERESKEKSKEFSSLARKNKQDKIDYVKKESLQVAKEAAGFICGGRRLTFCMGSGVSDKKINTTCHECGDRNGIIFLIDNKQLCGTCKIQKGAVKA